LLSIGAAGLYGGVVLLCVLAAATAAFRQQQGWHVTAWLLLALLFVVLCVLRVYGIEEAVRDDLRTLLYRDGVYDERRAFQRPMAASVLALVAIGFAIWIYRGFRTVHGRRNVAVLVACASAFAMVGLMSFRLISLSPIDKLLYGPIKLNWIVDLASSLLVLAAAGYYARLVGRKQ
jgi:hypothetical protein